MAIDTSAWKRCSSCKNGISFRATYWVCSVSTCTRKRTGMVFCSVACWEMHLPMMRHREAYALEERSPSPAEWQREQERELAESQAAPAPAGSGSQPVLSQSAPASPGVVARRRIVESPPELSPEEAELAQDILVVASKLKKYIRVRSGMNTSEGVMSVLSDHLRALCNQAIRTAAQDGRKTVLDRDIPKVVGD